MKKVSSIPHLPRVFLIMDVSVWSNVFFFSSASTAEVTCILFLHSINRVNDVNCFSSVGQTFIPG